MSKSTHNESTADRLRQYKAHAQLLDGRQLLIRAIRPEDKVALQNGLQSLEPESAYFRFFQPKQDLSREELIYLTEIDFCDHVALLAIIVEDGKEIVAGGSRYIVYQQEPVLAAELTFTVNDQYHGLGIGTLLLRHMLQLAKIARIAELHASVLPDNLKMLSVFSNSGITHDRSIEEGIVHIRFSVNDDHTYI